MTAKQLGVALSLEILAGKDSMDAKVDGCYIGDLLSWVMSHAKENNVWITVMGNVNTIAVAKLARISCIILCEGAQLDGAAKVEAEANGIPVLCSGGTAYAVAAEIAALPGGKI